MKKLKWKKILENFGTTEISSNVPTKNEQKTVLKNFEKYGREMFGKKYDLLELRWGFFLKLVKSTKNYKNCYKKK